MPCCRPCGRPTGRAGRRSAAGLVLDSATLTGVLDRLESARLIRREAHAHDRRINRIRLTTEGQGRREALERAMDGLNAEVAQAFGAEADTLWRLLRQLAGAPLAKREG
jgi:MarR family transcriptional regulator, organic hydroperoxide resistance regulator